MPSIDITLDLSLWLELLMACPQLALYLSSEPLASCAHDMACPTSSMCVVAKRFFVAVDFCFELRFECDHGLRNDAGHAGLQCMRSP
jgi:hypothetical protein